MTSALPSYRLPFICTDSTCLPSARIFPSWRLSPRAGKLKAIKSRKPELPERITLFVGDSSAAGAGVERQEQALEMQTPELPTARLGCADRAAIDCEIRCEHSSSAEIISQPPSQLTTKHLLIVFANNIVIWQSSPLAYHHCAFPLHRTLCAGISG